MQKFQIIVIGFAFAAVLLITVDDAFADHAEVTIVTVDESGFSQTCAASQGGPGCYTPVTATVDVGGVVTMTNTDPSAMHSFTSGTVDGFAPSPDGAFDSSILASGDAFEWIPTQAGEQPYYCMLHVWMIGTIIVQEAVAEEPADDPIAPFTILDDSTGGDCQHIGTWNAASKTCTITEDITVDSSDAIIIGSDGITLQGDVNIQGVTTNYSYFGILVDGKSNITLKDFNLLDFKYGVMAKNIDTLTIKDVTSDGIGQYVVNYQVDNSNNVIVENLVSSSNNRCYGQTYGCESELFITNNNNVVIRDSYSGTIKMGNSHNVELSNVNVGGGHPNYGYGIISIADRSSNVNIHDSTFSKLNTSGGQFGISYAQDGGCSQSDVPRVCTSVGTVGTGVVIKNNEIISGMGASGLGASFTISGNTFTNAYNHGCGLSFSAGNHINKLWGNGGHIISDNSFSCPGNSIYILGNDGTVISGNTFQDADSGIKLRGSQNNEIFENNFINIINPVLPLNCN